MLNFSDLKVLVIGDVCLDITEEGSSTRLSPEAPVPVILNPTETYSLGMAANVALNIYKLSANVDFTFLFGEDYYGDIFGKLGRELLGGCVNKHEEGDIATTVKKRILANGNQVARLDFEKDVDKESIDILIRKLQYRVDEQKKYDLIIISDYNKGIITRYSWRYIKPLLEQLSDNFFIDTKKKNVLDFYEGMHIFPNAKEMEEIMAYNNCMTRNELRQEMDLDFIIETASENGAYIYTNEGKLHHAKPYVTNGIIDVTGAGDTFLAAFALYYTKTKKKLASLDFANYCCSKVVMKKGTTPISIVEVLDYDTKGF